MSIAEALRRKLRVSDAVSVTEAVRRSVEPYAVEEAAHHASSLLAASVRRSEALRAVRTRRFSVRRDAFGADPAAKARALAELDQMALQPNPLVIGGAVVREAAGTMDAGPAEEVAAALAVTLAELPQPRVRDAHAMLHEAGAAVACGHEGSVSAWERALHALLPQFRANARAIGHDGESSAAEALASAAALRGRMRARRMTPEALETVFALASAAAQRVSIDRFHEAAADASDAHARERAGRYGDDVARERRARSRSALPEAASRQDDASAPKFLLRIWKPLAIRTDLARETPQLLEAFGRAATHSAFFQSDPLVGSKGSWDGQDGGADEEIAIVLDGVLVMSLGRAWMEPLVHLAAEAARRRLMAWAASHETPEDLAARLEALAEALGRGRVHLPIPAIPLRTAHPQPGMRLHEAAPTGRWPSRIVCEGKGGRAVVCRAYADDAGRLVGYGAFDPLSGEFRGRGLRAFYDLGGERVGRIEGDEGGWRLRAGDPQEGFVTAPPTIEV